MANQISNQRMASIQSELAKSGLTVTAAPAPPMAVAVPQTEHIPPDAATARSIVDRAVAQAVLAAMSQLGIAEGNGLTPSHPATSDTPEPLTQPLRVQIAERIKAELPDGWDVDRYVPSNRGDYVGKDMLALVAPGGRKFYFGQWGIIGQSEALVAASRTLWKNYAAWYEAANGERFKS